MGSPGKHCSMLDVLCRKHPYHPAMLEKSRECGASILPLLAKRGEGRGEESQGTWGNLGPFSGRIRGQFVLRGKDFYKACWMLDVACSAIPHSTLRTSSKKMRRRQNTHKTSRRRASPIPLGEPQNETRGTVPRVQLEAGEIKEFPSRPSPGSGRCPAPARDFPGNETLRDRSRRYYRP